MKHSFAHPGSGTPPGNTERYQLAQNNEADSFVVSGPLTTSR